MAKINDVGPVFAGVRGARKKRRTKLSFRTVGHWNDARFFANGKR